MKILHLACFLSFWIVERPQALAQIMEQERPVENEIGRSKLLLWYDQPANEWMTEALPIGNGYMGAMIFGRIEKEQIQFTEGSLWSGGPGAHEI